MLGPMQGWEYKLLKRVDATEAKLNSLGAEGWELLPLLLPDGAVPNSFEKLEAQLVLRRPRR